MQAVAVIWWGKAAPDLLRVPLEARELSDGRTPHACQTMTAGRCSSAESQAAMDAGWHEKTEWKEGLARTVEWYRRHGLSGYWDDDAVEKSLDAHPTFCASQGALDMPAHGLPKPGLS